MTLPNPAEVDSLARAIAESAMRASELGDEGAAQHLWIVAMRLRRAAEPRDPISETLDAAGGEKRYAL